MTTTTISSIYLSHALGLQWYTAHNDVDALSFAAKFGYILDDITSTRTVYNFKRELDLLQNES